MSTDAKIVQIANLGEHAALALANPAIREAVARMKAQIHAEWLAMPVYDTAAQQLVLQRAKLAELFEENLHRMVQHGKQAGAELNAANEKDMQLTAPQTPSRIERELARVKRRRAG